MTGVTVLARPLPHIVEVFDALSSMASQLLWRLAGVEALGKGAAVLYEAEGQGQALTFLELYTLLTGVDQVIDGEFIGELPTGVRALLVRAVDSTAYDVESADEEVISVIEGRFTGTERY